MDDYKCSIWHSYLSVLLLDLLLGSFAGGDALLHSDSLNWELQQAFSAGTPSAHYSRHVVSSGFDGVTFCLFSPLGHSGHLCWMLRVPDFNHCFYPLCIPFLVLAVYLINSLIQNPKHGCLRSFSSPYRTLHETQACEAVKGAIIAP